jgi:solute carrier family 35, member F5
MLPLVPMLLRQYRHDPTEIQELLRFIRSPTQSYSRLSGNDTEEETDPMMKSTDSLAEEEDTKSSLFSGQLSLKETAKLSLSFSLLWFCANYFAIACLEYTTVGSATILTSTSSIWTLLVGTFAGVERFTVKKLIGVLASLVGIVLISSIDVYGSDSDDRGTFPHKSAREIAIGDTIAFISAVIYGFYAVVLKKRIGDETRVNMPLFFGFVGAFNIFMMWPGFIILHFTNIERFALPPTGHVLLIILVNSLSSVFSDFCWAFAMLLTSPLIVTVGLSLTIPLSLVGQMILNGMYTGFAYWFGASIVVASFVFINHEESKNDDGSHQSSEPTGLTSEEVDWQA